MAANDPGFVRVPVKGDDAGVIGDENLPTYLRSDAPVASLTEGAAGLSVAANVAILDGEDTAALISAKVDAVIDALVAAGLMAEPEA